MVGRRLIRGFLRLYMRVWHRLDAEGVEHVSSAGPALLLWNHASYLDGVALMALDPAPEGRALVLASVARAPLVGWIVRLWDPIPVERDGRDTATIGEVLRTLRAGRPVAVAVEGIRSRDGRFGRVHPVLAHLARTVDVPLVPIGIGGSHRALGVGRWLPRRRPISIRIGEPFRVTREATPDEAAARIREAIERLLPGEQHADGTSGEPRQSGAEPR